MIIRSNFIMTDLTRQIHEKILNGFVPVCLTIEGFEEVLCYNILRSLNLGLFVYEKLSHFIPEKCPDLWFELNGAPLRWQLPIGVIYDCYTYDSDKVEILPITIHTTNFPPQTLIRCDERSTALNIFCHSFKQSLHATYEKIEFLQQNTNFHKSLANFLLLNKTSDALLIYEQRIGEPEKWKNYPIRIVNHTTLTTTLALSPINENKTISDILQMKGFSAENKFFIEGITVDPSTPLSKAVPFLMNPDGFLYITV